MLCDILFTSCLIDIFHGWNTDWMITWGMIYFIHVYFMLKLIVKEEGMIPCSVNWGVYTAITPHQRAPNHAIHWLNFLNKKELIGKMILCFLSTVTIYKTGNSQLSSTRALVKTMLFLFGTHAYWTESPVQNLFLVWIRVSQYHYWASLLCQKSYLYGAGYVMQMY